MVWLFITFAILYGLLAWRRLEFALGLLVFLLPAYQIRFQLGPIPMTLLEAMVIILFAAWLILAARRNELPLLYYLSFPRKRESSESIKPYPFGYELIILLIIAFVSAGVAGFSAEALGLFKAYFLEVAMFFIVFVNIYKDPAQRPKIFWALALSALAVSLVAIYQKFTGQLLPADWQDTGRVTGVFTYPNALGLYLGPIVVLLMGYALSLRGVRRSASQRATNERRGNPLLLWWNGIASLHFVALAMTVVLSLCAVALAKSEGALAGIFVALVFIGLFYSAWSRRIMITLLVIGAVVLSFNAGLRHDFIKKTTLMDTDGQIRRQQWHETWQMLNASPQAFIFGAGLANYQRSVAPYHASGIYVRNDDPEFDKWVRISLEYQKTVWQPLEIYLYPHNIMLNFWSELGIAGALLFLWIIVKFVILNFRLLILDDKNRGIVLGLLGAMTVTVVHGLVDVPYFKNDLALLFWLLVGIAGVLHSEFFRSIDRYDDYKNTII